ncbi:MAG TPA: pyridoxal phosphate-dependent aminotransferase [Candidatus Limadaptatus stercoravium]|nr:pyridoxal phosphate-dependent aminotransferase [Candidatus Limadaptatus stercoravium]
MYNKTMYELGSHRSVIRDLFEFGKKRAAEVGADKVYDFSLGNPNVPAPDGVRAAAEKLLAMPDNTVLHGYTSAQGDAEVRKAVADNINARFGTGISPDLIYMTCGAAASLTITLNALYEDGDEFILLAPFFPEYSVFVKAAGGTPVVVPFDEKTFAPDLSALEKAVTPRTKGVIVNSPNNPSGTVYTRKTLDSIVSLLERKSAEYGRKIVLIADEPYRELVYDDIEVPYLPNLYPDTVVCYSYSKSLSLPGERIGYIAISPRMTEKENVYAAVCGAGRALGYVCAPSMFQRVAAACVNERPDITAYRRNRDLIYSALTKMGYDCVHPDGAFYLFVRSPEPDANAFSERAKTFGLLIVPGDTFGAPGYVRISYCVGRDMIERSLPAFRDLINTYKK